MIRSYRQDRIIILTTHFMDEADILGDRIAIMAEGKLRCVGSSLWLKKQYSVGYQLTMERNRSQIPSKQGLNGDGIDSDSDNGSTILENEKLKRIVTNAVPLARIISDVGAELSYRLPVGESSRFPSMFKRLDEQIDRGVISSYGVSVTTLNAVFLAVTKGERATTPSCMDGSSCRLGSSHRLDSSQNAIPNVDDSDDKSNPDSRTITQPSRVSNNSVFKSGNKQAVIDLENDALFFRHMTSLLKKRALYFRRDKKAWICTTLVPSIFVLIGLVVYVSFAANRNLSPLNLNFQDYNPVLGNTIPFNSPESPFLCQTGMCTYLQPYVDNKMTNELYVWCGFESRIGINENETIGDFAYQLSEDTCSISHSRDILNSVVSDQVSIEGAGVRNISEVSCLCVSP